MTIDSKELKTLIVPAEIKSRELDSRILMGVLAAQNDWRVIFGSKSLLNRRVWKYQGDVYICQTLTKRRQNNLSLFTNLGMRNIGWDEEGLVYYGRDIYLSRRVSESSLSLMDGLVAWGEVSKCDLALKADNLDLELRALGNPRMDLLRPELRGIFEKEAKSISDKYGDFILLNTNFPSVNPHETVGDARSKVMQADSKNSSEAAKRFADMQGHRKKTLDAFFELLPNLAHEFPDTNIIIRPHPAESLLCWNEKCADFKNLVIVQEGSVIPWLMAAKALLHNGCTTAIEYYLVDQSAIAYCPEGRRDDESPLPNGVSHIASTQAELLTLAKKSVAGQLSPSKEHTSLMTSYLSSQKGDMASKQIIAFCEEIIQRKKPMPSLWKKYTTLLYCALRLIHRSTRSGDPARDYIARVFPQTSLTDIQRRANEMYHLLDLKTPITVKELAKNIFEIKAKS